MTIGTAVIISVVCYVLTMASILFSLICGAQHRKRNTESIKCHSDHLVAHDATLAANVQQLNAQDTLLVLRADDQDRRINEIRGQLGLGIEADVPSAGGPPQGGGSTP